MVTKEAIVSRVDENQEAIVIVLTAKNAGGEAILDTQINLAVNMAKNVLQMAGAEVSAAGSAVRFDATATGEIAKLTATLETVVPGASEDETDETEEPTEPDTETEE